MKIQPIRSEADFDAALATVEKLWGAKAGTADGDRLDVLLVLVEAYEEKRHPIDPPDPVEAIKFRMEQMNLTRKDLEPLLGSRGRVTEVINRRRPLSLAMIRNLHRSLRIPLESLVRESTRVQPVRHLGTARRTPGLRRSQRALG
jgi:HTH-type transcriptional regulator / antitoxin HigA